MVDEPVGKPAAEPGTAIYAGWQPVPDAPPRSRRMTIFLWTTLGGAILLAILYGLAYLRDPDGNDGLALLARATIAVAGAAFLAVARGIARSEPGRVKSILTLGATVFLAALVDALFLFFDAAADLPDLTRTLAFLFMGVLIGTQLLLLLRKGKADENSVAGFFAKNAAVVAFLLFLIVARVALKDVLATLLPSLFLNLIFLVLFLWAAIYLIARFLKRFGSPISWGEAKRHEQTVERLSDPRMEDVRGLLQQYIGTGNKLTEYQDMMRSVMARVEANPGEIEPLLARAPAPLRPTMRATPTGVSLTATFAVAAALATLATALLSLTTKDPGVWLTILTATGILQPLVGALLRTGESEPAPAAHFWLAATLAGLGAGLSYLFIPGLLLAIFAGGVCAFLYIAQGVVLLLRTSRRPQAPDHAYRRAEAADTQTRRARGLILWGVAIALAAPLWMLVALAAGRWIQLDNPPLVITIAALAAGALFAAGGYFLGPMLRQHREELRSVHKQETGLRQSYHRLLVKKLEGART